MRGMKNQQTTLTKELKDLHKKTEKRVAIDEVLRKTIGFRPGLCGCKLQAEVGRPFYKSDV